VWRRTDLNVLTGNVIGPFKCADAKVRLVVVSERPATVLLKSLPSLRYSESVAIRAICSIDKLGNRTRKDPSTHAVAVPCTIVQHSRAIS
jgi:hypothetical protein